jgi:hypothetical protein
VTRLEPTIQSLVESLCTRFCDFQKLGEPINLEVAFSALTTDIITEYSFARSYGYLDKKEFAPEWLDILRSVSEASHLNKQFGWLLPLMKSLPIWVVEATNPQMMRLINFQKVQLHLYYGVLPQTSSILIALLC